MKRDGGEPRPRAVQLGRARESGRRRRRTRRVGTELKRGPAVRGACQSALSAVFVNAAYAVLTQEDTCYLLVQ